MGITGQYRRVAHRVILLCFALGSLDACSNGSDSFSFDPVKNVHDVMIAATGPLEDLNLRREDIPPLLSSAAKNPYALPPQVECAPLRTEIAQLDTLLGTEKEQTDMTSFVHYQEGNEDSLVPKLPDMPKIPDSATLAEKGLDAAHDRALSFIHDQTNIMPFRSIIRTITGAEQHARKVQRAKEAGLMRRAFLKGVATAKFGPACLAPPVMLEVNAAPSPAR